MRAVSYARVSTEGQEDGSSIEGQFEANRSFAARRGLEVVREFSDVASGTLYAERQGLQNALKTIKDGLAEVVIVFSTDRAGRSDAALELFIREVFEFGGKLAITQTGQLFDDYETADMALYLPSRYGVYEHKSIQNRTNRGKLEHIKYGSYMTRPPLGYRIEKVAVPEARIKVNRLVIDEDEGKIVKDIFNQLIGGVRHTEILRTVNQRYNRTFTSKLIRIMVKSKELYAGKPQTRQITVSGKKHSFMVQAPPLINGETLQALEVVRFKPKNKAAAKPLAGRVHCSNCGSKATGKLVDGKWVTYFCLSKNRARVNKSLGKPVEPTDCNKHIGAKKLEDAVVAFVTDPRFPGGLRELRVKQEADKKKWEARLRGLATQLAEKDKEIDELRKKVLSLDYAALAQVAGIYNDRLIELQAEREAQVIEAEEMKKAIELAPEIPAIFDVRNSGFDFGYTKAQEYEHLNELVRRLGIRVYGNLKTGGIEVRLDW